MFREIKEYDYKTSVLVMTAAVLVVMLLHRIVGVLSLKRLLDAND